MAGVSKATKAHLEARLAAMEEENARLREALAAGSAAEGAAESAARPATVEEPGVPRRHRGRAVLAVTLIVLGTLLAPIATVVGFAARQASDTEAFVSTLGPLAENPDVQAVVVDRAAAAIDDALDTDALVGELLDAIVSEESTPRLAAASELLGPLLADQARGATRSALTAAVESETFATVWQEALRITHAQLVGVLEGDVDGAVAVDDSGVVTIELEPMIAALKPALVDAGFTLADSIPAVDASIVVAEIPAVAKARLGYSILTTVGDLLPLIAFGLVVIGIAIHPRRPRAVVTAGTLLLLTGTVLGLTISIGGQVTAAMVSTQLPTGATGAVYGSLTGEMAAVMLAYVILGAVAIVAGLLAGSSPTATATRRALARTLGRGSAVLDRHGWRPEAVPAALTRLPWLLWVWLGAITVVLGATLRPLTGWDVLLAVVILAAAAALYGVAAAPKESATPSDYTGRV